MRVWAAGLVVTCALVGGSVGSMATSREARASVSIAVTWDGLLRGSSVAALVVPLESRSAWENGRIYTYTRVTVERTMAGEMPADSPTWVRTMGGVVDKIGQIVEGEAVLTPGQRSLLFLHPGPPGALEVTARGQGQFPVIADAQAASGPMLRVVHSRAAGALLEPHLATSSAANRLAADVLHGRSVDDVANDIAADWSHTHAK